MARSDPDAAARSARLSLGFSCLGHAYSHLFGPIFSVVVLALEPAMGLSHGEAISLIVVGNVLYGVAAPLAGWLGDRWNTTRMVAVYFFGTGGGMLMTGFAETPFQIALGLAATGLFASIYHPVGIAWVVRNASARGMALGVNGFFGGVGPATGLLSAGLLTEFFGWRSAFIVPGALVVATGFAFILLTARRVIVELSEDRRSDPPASRGDAVRAFAVLGLTLVCSGLIYQATQAALPKMFSVRLDDLLSGSVFGISLAVAVVYLLAGGLQVIGGYLADRFALKNVYIVCFLLQVPILVLAANVGGGPLIAVAILMVAVNVGSLPAENGLVARYAPPKWRGFVFGMKFILAFGVGGLGWLLEGQMYDLTGGFTWLFVILASLAAVALAAAVLLPTERPRTVTAPAE